MPQGLLRWLGGDIPRGGAEIALAFCLCVFRLHQSKGRRGCSGRLVVASLEETWGLLSRFDCVYSGYITQGCAGGALVGCYEPTCHMLLFPCTPESQLAARAGSGLTHMRCVQCTPPIPQRYRTVATRDGQRLGKMIHGLSIAILDHRIAL